VEGAVAYQTEGQPEEQFLFKFVVPYIGRNTYEHECPPGFAVEQSGGPGNQADVTFTILQRSPASGVNPPGD